MRATLPNPLAAAGGARGPLALAAAALALVVAVVVAVSFGRFSVPVSHVIQILASGCAPRRRSQ